MFAVWCELFYLHCIDAIRETLVTPPNLLFSQHVSQLVVEIVDFHLYKPRQRCGIVGVHDTSVVMGRERGEEGKRRGEGKNERERGKGARIGWEEKENGKKT